MATGISPYFSLQLVGSDRNILHLLKTALEKSQEVLTLLDF